MLKLIKSFEFKKLENSFGINHTPITSTKMELLLRII